MQCSYRIQELNKKIKEYQTELANMMQQRDCLITLQSTYEEYLKQNVGKIYYNKDNDTHYLITNVIIDESTTSLKLHTIAFSAGVLKKSVDFSSVTFDSNIFFKSTKECKLSAEDVIQLMYSTLTSGRYFPITINAFTPK